jgi:hypothetical protein
MRRKGFCKIVIPAKAGIHVATIKVKNGSPLAGMTALSEIGRLALINTYIIYIMANAVSVRPRERCYQRAARSCLFGAGGGVPLDLGSPCHAKGTQSV